MSSPTDLSAKLAEAEARIDVQQRQIAQLQAQLDMCQRAFDTLPLTIMWKDRSSTYLGCNAHFAHMAGAPSTADLIGKDDTMMPWAGEQADAFRADDREVMEIDRPKLRIVEPITDASGSSRWLETNKLPLHDASGAVIGIIGTIEDITERKLKEEQQVQVKQQEIEMMEATLRERDSLISDIQQRDRDLQIYRVIIEQSPNGVLITNSEGKNAYVNASFKRMSGMHADEITSLDQIFPASLHHQLYAEVSQTIRERGHWQGRIRLTRPDHSMWVSLVSLFMLQDPLNQQPRWVAFFRDISADDEASEALRSSEAQLRMLTESLPVALAVIDTQGIFQVSTGKGLEKLGLKPGQLVGASVFDVFEAAVNVIDDFHRCITGESFVEQRVLRGVAYETFYTPLLGDDGEVEAVVLVSTDITERIKADQESMQLKEQVIAAQQAALRELSTPLIPVADDVVVMPLIGSIDSSRAQQVIESLLEGVSRSRAKTAIIDITGVPVVDTQVANALLRAAQAVRLLGANVVLTGIRPEVAQTLVGLGADLSGITTRGTLQVAITQALNLAGQGA